MQTLCDRHAQDRYERVLEFARDEATSLGIHLLEKDQVIIDGVRFLGTTLWTDFEVEEPLLPRSLAYRYANGSMTDFSIIRYRDRLLSAQDSHELHKEARAWITERLAEPFAGKTVVVTHHLPHRGSIDRQFHHHPLNPAFASHMPELARPPVNLCQRRREPHFVEVAALAQPESRGADEFKRERSC